MKAAVDPIVRHLLAIRLDTPLDRIDADQHLQKDLGLDPLDLVLLALDLEQTEDAEFPIADLESVATVDDLSRLASAWRDANDVEPIPPPSVAVLRRRLRRATRRWQTERAEEDEVPRLRRLRFAHGLRPQLQRRTST